MQDVDTTWHADKLSVEADSEERFRQLKQDIHKRLVTGMDMTSIERMDDYELRRQLFRRIEELCECQAELISQANRERLANEVIDETLGFGPIDPLLRDPTVTDILINGPHTIYVERRGRLELAGVKFHDAQHLREITQRIINRSGRRLDEACPMADARMDDGSRVNAVIAPLALDGALVSIRRFSATPLLAGDLIARQALTEEMSIFLEACVRARLNIMISGGTGSGKTTLLNYLSGSIPSDERIATIEDAAELRLQQRHVARMETRPPNLEGVGEVTTRDLLKNSLRMRPDRIIIGECRGEEAFDMLQAMTTGHDGSLTTIHANDARDAISRLEMLVSMAGFDMPIWYIHRRIAAAIDIVLHCGRLSGGARKVLQISEVTGVESENVSMHDIFTFEQQGVDDQRRAKGVFTATGIRPICLEKMHSAGIDLPFSLFEPRVLQHNRLDTLRNRSAN